jgi:hypothetical protein
MELKARGGGAEMRVLALSNLELVPQKQNRATMSKPPQFQQQLHSPFDIDKDNMYRDSPDCQPLNNGRPPASPPRRIRRTVKNAQSSARGMARRIRRTVTRNNAQSSAPRGAGMARTSGKKQLSIHKQLSLVVQNQRKFANLIQEEQDNKSEEELKDLRQLLTRKCEESRRSIVSGVSRNSLKLLSTRPSWIHSCAGEDPSIDLPSSFAVADDVEDSSEAFVKPPMLLQCQSVNLGFFDINEQQQLFEDIEEGEDSFSEDDSSTPAGSDLLDDASRDDEEEDTTQLDEIEVRPGVTLPLKGTFETWNAILEGRITVSQCCTCYTELTCVDDAGLVLCTDCWVFSPVDQNSASITMDPIELQKAKTSVGIGIQTDQIFEWLSAREDAPLE